MPYTPAGIVSSGYPFGDFTFTYLLSGVAATDTAVAAAAGYVTTMDTTAASTHKLAGDGDPIHGRVYVAENRAVLGLVVASIARKFKESVPTAAGYTSPAVGDRVIGGGAGTVKKATANSGAGVPTDPIVVEVGTGSVVVEYL
jgi:hypothetical protein